MNERASGRAKEQTKKWRNEHTTYKNLKLSNLIETCRLQSWFKSKDTRKDPHKAEYMCLVCNELAAGCQQLDSTECGPGLWTINMFDRRLYCSFDKLAGLIVFPLFFIFTESSRSKNWESHDRFTPSTSCQVAKLSLDSHFPKSKTPGNQEIYKAKTFCSHQIWQIYLTKY